MHTGRKVFPEAPLKYVAQIRPSNVDKHIRDNEIPVRLCNYVDVYYNDRITDAIDFSPGSATHQEIERFTLRVGDVVITKDSELREDIAVPALVEESGAGTICGYHLAIVRPDPHRVSSPFLFWALSARPVAEQFSNHAKGITRFGLSVHGIGSVVIPLPELKVQKHIADFLDRETATFDRVVQKKARHLELLTEKRRATVARLIPPPDLPRNGLRLKHRLVANDGGLWGDDPDRENDSIVLRSTDQTLDGGWKISNPAIRSIPPAEAARRRLLIGDILITKSSGSAHHIGKASLVDEDVARLNAVFSNFNQRLRLARAEVPRFYWYYLNSPIARWHYVVHANSTSGLGNLNASIIGELPIPELDPHQQKAIADRLDEEIAGIDVTRKKIQETVSTLRELRSALITAAVTGQIDVAEWSRRGETERRIDEVDAEPAGA